MGQSDGMALRRESLSAAKRQLLESRLQGKASISEPAPSIPHLTDRQTAPLSFTQQRLWFLQTMDPGNPVYNRPCVIHFDGSLDAAALEKGLNCIMDRHHVLRTVFSLVHGEPVQQLLPLAGEALAMENLSHLGEREAEAAAWRRMESIVRTPFSLEQGPGERPLLRPLVRPLVRAVLFRLAPQIHRLLFVAHHLVFDGWSSEVFLRELVDAYRACTAGHEPQLPALPIQYADYAAWQRQPRLGVDPLSPMLGYWKHKLEGCPQALELPVRRPRPPVQTHPGARVSCCLSPALTAALHDLSRQQEATPFMTILAVYSILLKRLSGQNDLVIGTPAANRTRWETEPLIGPLINHLPLRLNLDGNLPFAGLLEQVRRTCLDAYAHQDLPFEKLIEELQVPRDQSRSPLFQVYLNMQFPARRVDLPGLVIEMREAPVPGSNFDLTLYVTDHPVGALEGTRLDLVYNPDLFDPRWAKEFLDQYHVLLEQVVGCPETPVEAFSLVTPASRPILPDPTLPLDPAWIGSIQELFSRQALLHPRHTALVDPQAAWTYGDVERTSSRIAGQLIQSGVRPQDVVAVYSHRSAPLVCAVLGILKAGAAFLILDPAYPSGRVAEYLHLTQPRGWIQMEAAGPVPEALERVLASLPLACRIVLPGLPWDSSPDNHQEMPTWPAVWPPVGPEDLAYITFTSGSTGKPKGIRGKHGSLTHFLPWMRCEFGLDENDRFSMLSGLSHDPLHRDIFTPLCMGATLCIPTPDDIVPGRLARWIQDRQVTVANLTPAMGQILVEGAPASGLACLRRAFFVGDVLTFEQVRRLYATAPHLEIINFYGSGETQRAVSYYRVPRDPGEQQDPVRLDGVHLDAVPLGKGIQDVQLLVLNGGMNLAGTGEVGEIYLRSPHLALGYLGDEGLTRQRFLSNPAAQDQTRDPADRLYKTGDLGRYLPDGNAIYSGRADRQVKIRGFRIEPGEIETALRQHPGIQDAVVLALEDPEGEKRLAAYTVSHRLPPPGLDDLRNFLQDRLPEVMLPSIQVCLESLPLTPNGKLDRAALPPPAWGKGDDLVDHAPPADEVEQTLVEIWQRILHRDRIGVLDNFFTLGGHSLMALQIFAEIERSFGMKLPLRSLYTAATIAQQAALLRAGQSDLKPACLVPLQATGSKKPLYCVHEITGMVGVYRWLITHFCEDQPIYGIQSPGQEKNSGQRETIESLASRYLQEIRAFQPEGPYQVCGYSFGGIVAYEMARQLVQGGEQVAFLGILDTQVSYAAHYIQALPWKRAARYRLKFLMAAATFHSQQLKPLGWRRRLQYIVTRLRIRLQGDPTLRLKPPDPSLPERIQENVTAHRRAYRAYVPGFYPGTLTLFRGQEQHLATPDRETLGWGALMGGRLEVVDVPGSHASMLEEPIVRLLAAKLSERLAAVQPRRHSRANTLRSGEIHVWHACLDRSDTDLQRFRAMLSPEEIARADRFVNPAHGSRFTAGRGILRSILGQYLTVDPRAIEFGYGKQGKPFLKGRSTPPMQFNVSHAHGSALYAFVLDHPIGIDLEKIDPSIEITAIAPSFFAPGEVRRLDSLPQGMQREAFFNGWTRKEAFIKALGDGLAFPLDGFEVSLEPGEPARLLGVDGKPGEEDRWELHAWQPEPGFTAALAVPGQGWKITFLDYDG